jgi:ADP-ribosylglycohydrolase
MHELLAAIHFGHSWRDEAPALFQGNGSCGNGAAMRTAPLGAYFADDLDRVMTEAERAAVVTHAHPEAVTGAIAVAIATAYAVRLRESTPDMDWRAFLDLLLPHIPEGIVRKQISIARSLPDRLTVTEAVALLGNGTQITAQDTVPFALWCATHHLHDFEAALWTTLAGGGDRDTNAAIVGGIIAASVGWEGIPATWRQAREPLSAWVQSKKGY